MIDLREAKLSGSQCARVVRSVAGAPLQGVTSLHISAEETASHHLQGGESEHFIRGDEISVVATVLHSLKRF